MDTENSLFIENIKKKIEKIDWEFSDSDTKYLTHNIHRYSGKFIPQIAKTVIELITKPGDLILDSYMGSGTTLLEASQLRRFSIGVDLNPLAVLISKVKTTPIEKEKLDLLLNYFESVVYKIDNQKIGQLSLFDENQEYNIPIEIEKKINFKECEARLEDLWNKKWYQPHVLKQLVYIYSYIQVIDDIESKNLALVTFSDILRRSSNANSKYPNIMYDKNVKEKPYPSKLFLKALKENIDKIKFLSDIDAIEDFKPNIYHGDNTSLVLKDESVDAIITHPPYIGSVPYAEYLCLSLEWLGYNYKELDSKLTGGRRQTKDVVERFEKNYRLMIQESYRVLKKGKILFLMVGNPTVNKEIVRLDLLTKDICESAGFELIEETTRQGKNRRGNNMAEEYLLFFVKK